LLRAASFTKLDAGLSRLAVKQQRTNRFFKLAPRPASTTWTLDGRPGSDQIQSCGVCSASRSAARGSRTVVACPDVQRRTMRQALSHSRSAIRGAARYHSDVA
jgi:hypothetical protein